MPPRTNQFKTRRTSQTTSKTKTWNRLHQLHAVGQITYLPSLQLWCARSSMLIRDGNSSNLIPIFFSSKATELFLPNSWSPLYICLNHFLFCCTQNHPILYHASHFVQQHIHSFPANFRKTKIISEFPDTLKSSRSNHIKQTKPFVTLPKLSYIIHTTTYVYFKYIRKHTPKLFGHSTIKEQMLHWFILTTKQTTTIIDFPALG